MTTQTPESFHRVRALRKLEDDLTALIDSLLFMEMERPAAIAKMAQREIQHLIDHRDSPAEVIMRGPVP